MTYGKLCACRRLHLNKIPGHNVLCCATRRGGQGRCNAGSEFSFCTNFFPRSLTRGKNLVCPGKKTVLSQGKIGCRCRTAGLERAGRARQGWLARSEWRAGAGQGRAGGTCVFPHKNVLLTCVGIGYNACFELISHMTSSNQLSAN